MQCWKEQLLLVVAVVVVLWALYRQHKRARLMRQQDAASAAELAKLRDRVGSAAESAAVNTPLLARAAAKPSSVLTGADAVLGVLVFLIALHFGGVVSLGGSLGGIGASGASPLDAFSHYEALGMLAGADGADSGATTAAIRKAYRQASLKYHPDKTKPQGLDTSGEFLRITEAYEVLSDAPRRAQHDEELARLRAMPPAARAAHERAQAAQRRRFYGNMRGGGGGDGGAEAGADAQADARA
eukprot:g3257.t1